MVCKYRGWRVADRTDLALAKCDDATKQPRTTSVPSTLRGSRIDLGRFVDACNSRDGVNVVAADHEEERSLDDSVRPHIENRVANERTLPRSGKLFQQR